MYCCGGGGCGMPIGGAIYFAKANGEEILLLLMMLQLIMASEITCVYWGDVL